MTISHSSLYHARLILGQEGVRERRKSGRGGTSGGGAMEIRGKAREEA